MSIIKRRFRTYAQYSAQKRIKNSKIMDIQTIINDLDIVIEAIKNNNNFDAIAMLVDIQQDLKVIALTRL